jgi:F-type H+/Na+-transporting ATPase subunit beta
MYYVYENWTNTFAKVHHGTCSYCNDGKGFQGRGTKTSNGQWHGPFTSKAEAMSIAHQKADRYANSDVWEVSTCGVCG